MSIVYLAFCAFIRSICFLEDENAGFCLYISSALCCRVLVQKDARLLRDIRLMAYFRQCFSSNLNISTIKELAHALASHPPYEVPISSIKIRHLHCQVSSNSWFTHCILWPLNLGLWHYYSILDYSCFWRTFMDFDYVSTWDLWVVINVYNSKILLC